MTELSDTHPDVERVQVELMRQAPPWRKLALMGQLIRSARELALAGLRQRYPMASDQERRRLLADMILGRELAMQAYGPLPPGLRDDAD